MKLYDYILCGAVALAMAACSDDIPDAAGLEGDALLQRPGTTITNDGATFAGAVEIDGSIETYVYEALRLRCSSAHFGSGAEMLVLANGSVGACADHARQVLDAGGVVAVVRPTVEALEHLGVDACMTQQAAFSTGILIYAFDADGHNFIMDDFAPRTQSRGASNTVTDARIGEDDVVDATDYAAALGRMVAWFNSRNDRGDSGDSFSIESYFKAQSVTRVFNLTIENQVVASVPEALPPTYFATIKAEHGASWQVMVAYTIYPLFSSTANKTGDYYAVTGQLTSFNQDACRYDPDNPMHSYWLVHGGLKSHPTAAFYMTNMQLDCTIGTLTDGTFTALPNDISQVDFDAAPTPATYEGESTYTTGIKWGFSGTLSGSIGSGTGSGGLDMQFTFGDGTSTATSSPDLKVGARNAFNAVGWDFNVQNLTNGADLTSYVIPGIACKTFTIPFNFVWHVKTTTAGDNATRLALKTAIHPIYASCMDKMGQNGNTYDLGTFTTSFRLTPPVR